MHDRSNYTRITIIIYLYDDIVIIYLSPGRPRPTRAAENRVSIKKKKKKKCDINIYY